MPMRDCSVYSISCQRVQRSFCPFRTVDSTPCHDLPYLLWTELSCFSAAEQAWAAFSDSSSWHRVFQSPSILQRQDQSQHSLYLFLCHGHRNRHHFHSEHASARSYLFWKGTTTGKANEAQSPRTATMSMGSDSHHLRRQSHSIKENTMVSHKTWIHLAHKHKSPQKGVYLVHTDTSSHDHSPTACALGHRIWRPQKIPKVGWLKS